MHRRLQQGSEELADKIITFLSGKLSPMKPVDDQSLLALLFADWYMDVGRVKVRSLYLFPRSGHTTLWLAIRDMLPDVMLFTPNREFGEEYGFDGIIPPNPKIDAQLFANLNFQDKFIIIDTGGDTYLWFHNVIQMMIDRQAKGILVS